MAPPSIISSHPPFPPEFVLDGGTRAALAMLNDMGKPFGIKWGAALAKAERHNTFYGYVPASKVVVRVQLLAGPRVKWTVFEWQNTDPNVDHRRVKGEVADGLRVAVPFAMQMAFAYLGREAPP